MKYVKLQTGWILKSDITWKYKTVAESNGFIFIENRDFPIFVMISIRTEMFVEI